MEDNKANPQNDVNEISLKEVIIKTNNVYLYLKSKWKAVLVFSLLGSVLGLAYSFFNKPQYTATCSFVLEDGSKAGLLSQYSGLASMAGIDIGGGGGGVFQGDNIIELYKSRTMIKKTLLSSAVFDGKSEMLIERYVSYNKLKAEWDKNNLKNLSFTGDPEKFNRAQDSIITDLVGFFNKKVLTVTKPDKKLNIINVTVVSTDELFAQIFTVKLVENVNSFYVLTKTKKSTQNVNILTRQRDSVRAILNGSISGVASAIDATPNANPLLSSLRASSQKKQVDVVASSGMYTEIVKQLEIAKISLQQETPLIQIIDKPVLPLEKERLSKRKGIMYGFLIGFFTSISVILLKRLFQAVMS
jgi:hypothetical protein